MSVEGTLVTSLSLPQNAEIRLWQRQVTRKYSRVFTDLRKDFGRVGQRYSCHLGRNLEAQKPQGGRR